MPRKRILFIAEAVTLAHVARPMVLAQGLDPSRWEVHFACAPRFLHLFPKPAFPVHAIDSIPGERFLRALAKGTPLYSLATLERYVAAEQTLFSQLQPDAVIGDFRLSLAVSATLASIPYLNITNAYWSPFAKQSFPVPELPWVKLLGPGLSQRLFTLARPAAFAYHALPMHRLRRRHGLPGGSLDLRRVYTEADQVLYADLPGWVPMDDALPEHHHYLGPLDWSPSVPLPAWWDSLPEAQPLVYVTLGSSGRAELLPLILEALRRMPVSLLAATAGRVDFTDLPPSVYVADYLPGKAAAARADLVICNGGSPTVYQALAAGVPVLGLPSNLDQYLNMQAVTRHGAGQCLRADVADTTSIRDAVRQLLTEPGFRDRARTLSERFSTCLASSTLEAALSSCV